MLVLHLSKHAVGFLSRHHLIKTNVCYTAAFRLLSLHFECVFNKKYSISKLGLIKGICRKYKRFFIQLKVSIGEITFPVLSVFILNFKF